VGVGETQHAALGRKPALGDLRSPSRGSATAEGDETQYRTWGVKPGVGDVRSSPHDRPTPRRFKDASRHFVASSLSRRGLRPVVVFIEPRQHLSTSGAL